jgi:predicted dehydrogenase
MKKKPAVRGGIVGSGFAASLHFEALKRIYGVQVDITGVFSRSPEKRERFAREKGILACSSLDEVLENSDVIHVCTPPAYHEALAVEALRIDRYAIVEKPLTGYFGDGADHFNGYACPKKPALEGARASVLRMIEAEEKSNGKILYAENWVYAPAVQKEREIIEKTGAHILWIHGEEAHSGSHSPVYGDWSQAGGGSMIGKGCHPLSAALYLKRVEGLARRGRIIRPETVTGRIHILTRSEHYIDRKHLRTDYKDIEDFSMMHVQFEDNTVADIFASEIIMGGIHNWLEVAANNHRTICRMNPNSAMQTYNPSEDYFRDIYVVEKIGTKQGWSFTSPDEDWFHGFQQEMEAFYRAVAFDDPVQSDSLLAADTILTIYSAYLSAEQGGREVTIPLIQ